MNVVHSGFGGHVDKGSATGRQVIPIAIEKFRIILTRSQNRSLMMVGGQAGGVK